MEEKYLCFIKLVGRDIEDMYTYEFLFTETPDTVWGVDFEYTPCCLCNNLTPNEEDYDTIKTLKTTIKLNLIQDSCCFSMQDMMDGCCSLAYESLEDYEEYPEDGRLVFQYGISFEETEELLANKNLVFE